MRRKKNPMDLPTLSKAVTTQLKGRPDTAAWAARNTSAVEKTLRRTLFTVRGRGDYVKAEAAFRVGAQIKGGPTASNLAALATLPIGTVLHDSTQDSWVKHAANKWNVLTADELLRSPYGAKGYTVVSVGDPASVKEASDMLAVTIGRRLDNQDEARGAAAALLEDVNLHTLVRQLKWKPVWPFAATLLSRVTKALKYDVDATLEFVRAMLLSNGYTRLVAHLDGIDADEVSTVAPIAPKAPTKAPSGSQLLTEWPWAAEPGARVVVVRPRLRTNKPWWQVGVVGEDGKWQRDYLWQGKLRKWSRRKGAPDAALLTDLATRGWVFGDDFDNDGMVARLPPRAGRPAQPAGESARAPAKVKGARAPKRVKVEYAEPRSIDGPAEGDIAVYVGKGTAPITVYRIDDLTKKNKPARTYLGNTDGTQKQRVFNRVPAADFTLQYLLGRKSRGPDHTSILKPGPGGALVRYYLDKTGAEYDPDARIVLRVFHGAYSGVSWFDITNPGVTLQVAPAERARAADAAAGGDPTIKPEANDLCWEGTGRSIYGTVLRGMTNNPSMSLAFLRGLQPHAVDGVKHTATLRGMSYMPKLAVALAGYLDSIKTPAWKHSVVDHYGRADVANGWWHTEGISDAVAVATKDFTATKLRQWGAPWLEVLAAAVATNIRAIIRKEWGDVPGLDTLVPTPVMPEGGRLLYRASSAKPWADITVGSAATTRFPRLKTKTPEKTALTRSATVSPAKLRTLADKMEDSIRAKLSGDSRTNTPKRARQAASTYADGAALQRTQRQLYTLADMADANTLPPVLAGISTRAAVQMMSHPWDRLQGSLYHEEKYDRSATKIEDINKVLSGEYPVSSLHDPLLGSPPEMNYPGAVQRQHITSAARDLATSKKQDARAFYKWSQKGPQYSTHMVQIPLAVAELIGRLIKAGTLDDQWMADIAAKVRRLARAGLETPALWYEAVNAYRPIWEAGRASNRVVSKHEQQIAKLLGEIRFAKIPGFFPTPDTVANRMAEMAQIATRGEVSVLEPGGGTGSLVEAVYRRNKNARVVIYERQHTLAELLRLKFPEATVHFEDFTEAAPSPTFDVVIMNPPYEKRQDAEQVVRAWRWVKPGGILVALISEGPFTATDKKSLALREWLESVDGRNIPLKNAFKGRDVFRQTGVATRIIVARKDR